MTHDIAIGPELPFVEKSFEHDASEQRDFALAALKAEPIGVEILHSGGQWLPGWLDCNTVHSRYPSVLFDGTDCWTTVHESKIRRV